MDLFQGSSAQECQAAPHTGKNVARTHQEVVEEVLVVPGDTGILVGLGVREAFSLAGLAVDEAVQVGTLLVTLTSTDGVALRALGLEDLGAGLDAGLVSEDGCHSEKCEGLKREK